MAAPQTGQELIDLLETSQLLDGSLIGKLRKKAVRAGGSAQDPKKLGLSLVKSKLATVWQVRQLLAGRYKGFYVGKYKFLELLGSGGMGKVFLAEHLSMQRMVAIKVMRNNQPKNRREEVLARFTREARAVAALQHPNIIQAFDFDEDNGVPYIVMEYVEGIDASYQVHKFGPIPWRQAADYMAQAAAGLSHAHAAGLVHRDIKPGNLLIDRHGLLRVLDLGLVSCFDDGRNDSLTVEENQLGTVDYIAPEQALDSHDVDARADIYSLGAAFYFLVSGSILFPDKTTAQKLLAHQALDPMPIRERVPDLPEELADIITRMLQKNPDDRFQSAGDIEAALKPFAERVVPPYDVSAVRYSRESIEPYLRKSPDASTLNVASMEQSTLVASDGSDPNIRKAPPSMITVGMADSASGTDSFMNAGASYEDFELPPPPRRRASSARKTKNRKRDGNPLSRTHLMIAGAVAAVLLVVFTGFSLARRLSAGTDESLTQAATAETLASMTGTGTSAENRESRQSPSGKGRTGKGDKKFGGGNGSHQWIGNTLADGETDADNRSIHIHLGSAIPGNGYISQFKGYYPTGSGGKLTVYLLRPAGAGQYRVIHVHEFAGPPGKGMKQFRLPERWLAEKGDVIAHSGAAGPAFLHDTQGPNRSLGNISSMPQRGDTIDTEPLERIPARQYALQFRFDGVVVSDAVEGSGYRKWHDFSNELQDSPGLVWYQNMVSPSEWKPTKLRNLKKNSGLTNDGGFIDGATWVEGRWPKKQALEFRGPEFSDHVRIPGKAFTDEVLGKEMSIVVWLRIDESAGYAQFVIGRNAHWRLKAIKGRNHLEWSVNRFGSAGYQKLEGATHVLDGKWHLAVVTYRVMQTVEPQAQIRLFVDGRHEATGTTTPIDSGQNPDIEIGRDPSSPDRNLLGQIDELAIFGRELQAAEIMTIYEHGFPSN